MTNYQLVCDSIINNLGDNNRLLLHVCCAPCSSYVLEYLSHYFDITVFFYNPNITDFAEYEKRKAELKRFISEYPFGKDISVIDGDYDPDIFYTMAKGRENIPEGGERCFDCYKIRMEKTAKLALEGNYDYFCTTLSVSPHKNSEKLNETGKALSEKYGISYLYSDFKKRNGYKRSIELSAEYGLYRQNYCGCVYSKLEADRRTGKKF